MPLIKGDGTGLFYLLRVGGPVARVRALARELDEPAQAVVGGALGEAPELGQLRERGVRVFETQLQHLAQGGREDGGVEAFERPLLAGGGGGGAARAWRGGGVGAGG